MEEPLIIPYPNHHHHPSIVVYDDTEPDVTYHASVKIGSACNDSIPVYTGTINNNPAVHVFIKFASSCCDDKGALTKLRIECSKNDILAAEHPNVLGVMKRFMCDGFFCVVLPRFDVSLRIYDASSIPNPKGYHHRENYILLILREVLRGLSFIHDNGHVHGQVNADHVYFVFASNGWKQVKLGYAASICDVRGRTSISGGGSSPAAIYLPPDEEECLTSRSDMWSLGVMALELACGVDVRVKGRRALDALVKRIKRLLPSREERLKKDSYYKNSSWLMILPWNNRKNINDEDDQRCGFSKDFSNMIVKCLDSDPSKRPCANDLLRSNLFRHIVARTDIVSPN